MLYLSLRDATTSEYIGETEADFVPADGETFIFAEGTQDEAVYRVVKRMYPTLMRRTDKVVRLKVTLAT